MSSVSRALETQRPFTDGFGRWLPRVVATALLASGLLTLSYAGLCLYVATRLVYVAPTPVTTTPASLGLAYREVTFPSRGDHVLLKGWYIPGVLPDGQLTTATTIIAVHGLRTNRTDPGVGLLALSGALARQGFAVLAFDMRGMGASPPAPISFGLDEQRDVLGAVDWLRSGVLPYPALGRPRHLLGWGVSMGAATLLFAAAQEPAIQAVVSDSAYADLLPVLEKQLPPQSGLPAFFTPGILEAARALYGIDYTAVRPVDVVARLAPRPVFFIQGANDTYVPTSALSELDLAARAAPGARVQSWLVPGASHAQSFHVAGAEYVTRVVAFYRAALGQP
ncbi:MAG TPA: alpha/beta hydrolase [Ktedonobacterales bacterium]|nr:alpha/beta hydrolase [Ktedonobacterales bacterium]